MCSMASSGSSTPTMRPTSRAHSPPQLTTCSAFTVPCSVTTFQVPSGSWVSSTTRLRRLISAPSLRAALA